MNPFPDFLGGQNFIAMCYVNVWKSSTLKTVGNVKLDSNIWGNFKDLRNKLID